MKSQTFNIRGMFCHNCEKRVAAALRKLEGAEHVRVDYASGEAVVESRNALEAEQVEAALRDADPTTGRQRAGVYAGLRGRHPLQLLDGNDSQLDHSHGIGEF